MFIYETTIRMRQTDAAGVMSFCAIYGILHDAYEEFLSSRGLPLATILRDRPYLLPIVHSEADFHRPLTLGEPVQVRLRLENLGTTSFAISYKVTAHDQPVITAHTAHVVVDKATQRPLPLPDELKTVFSGI